MGLLEDARTKAEASVPEKYRKGFNAIMAAGLKMMFSEKTFPEMTRYLATIKNPQDIPRLVGHGITKLFSMLINGLKGKLPLEPSGAAMVVLMTHALEYIERVMKIPITPEILAETTRLVSQGHMLMVKQASGLNDQQFQQILSGNVRSLMQQGSNGAQPQPTGGV